MYQHSSNFAGAACPGFFRGAGMTFFLLIIEAGNGVQPFALFYTDAGCDLIRAMFERSGADAACVPVRADRPA